MTNLHWIQDQSSLMKHLFMCLGNCFCVHVRSKKSNLNKLNSKVSSVQCCEVSITQLLGYQEMESAGGCLWDQVLAVFNV